MKKIKLIIFDLGRVLVELGETPFPTDWVLKKDLSPKEWLHDEIAMSFEKGNISAVDFADKLIVTHKLSQKNSEIIYEFSKWIKGLYPEVLDTVQELRKNYQLAILSNTNEIHWPILINDFGLKGNFDFYFASHLIHLAKPDKKIYEHVINETGIAPENIIFFDDNLDNINSANEMGIKAVHLEGFSLIKKYLVEHEFL